MQKGDKPDMLAAKENGEWKQYSTSEIASIVEQIATGFLHLGVGYGDGTAEGRDKIAVLSKNRPEWLMLDLAVQKSGAVLTPFYPTIHINELEYVLNDAKVKYIFVNDENEFEKVTSIQDRVPSLRGIYTFEKVSNAAHWKEMFQPVTESCKNNLKNISDSIKNEDLATIIYTSGTTGKPKGVMLSHDNILSNVIASIPCLPVTDLKVLSFLPLNHIYERMISYFYLYKGA